MKKKPTKKIAIVTPTYSGTVHWSHVPAVAAMAGEQDYLLGDYVVTAGASLVDHARNCCAHDAHGTGNDWFIWLDADTVPSVDTLYRLCRKASEIEADGNNAFLLAAVVPVRPTHAGVVGAHDFGQVLDTDYEGVTEVEHVGMACTLMTRQALDFVREFGRSYSVGNGITMHESFHHGVGRNNRYIGEDVSFCRTLRAAGGRVFLDNNNTAGHFAARVYVGGKA